MSLPKFGNATKLYPLIWRFLPAIDPQVDLFFSRDLDSRISLREVEAVTEFLNSDVQVAISSYIILRSIFSVMYASGTNHVFARNFSESL